MSASFLAGTPMVEISKRADWQNVPLADLLPQAPPMVLLDHVVAYDEQSLEADVTITRNSLFFEPTLNGVPAWVCIEYMAQAIAALGGLHAREQGHVPRIGFLLGTRKLLLHEKVLLAGQTYRVQVHSAVQDDAGLAGFACRLLRGQKLCAEASVNVFVPPAQQQDAGNPGEGANLS